MENKLFRTNQEFADYLERLGFVEVSEKIFPDKPGKRAFKRKRFHLYFDYINISISKNAGIIYNAPEISVSELERLIS